MEGKQELSRGEKRQNTKNSKKWVWTEKKNELKKLLE